MRLLNLSEYAQEQLVEGNISQGHAKVLVGLDRAKQKVMIDSIVGQKLSVREAENIVKNYKNNSTSQPNKVSKTSLLDEYKEAFNAVLPYKHKVKSNSVEISFSSPEEIENFLSILKKA
jgi:ParB family chromosome partitioning protein